MDRDKKDKLLKTVAVLQICFVQFFMPIFCFIPADLLDPC